jgi:hypothetical protein
MVIVGGPGAVVSLAPGTPVSPVVGVEVGGGFTLAGDRIAYGTLEHGVGTPQAGATLGGGAYWSVESFYNARVLSISTPYVSVNIGHIGWMPVGVTLARSITPPLPIQYSVRDVATTTGIVQVH